MTDYILIETANVFWPGMLPYRGKASRRGYPTEEAARQRAARIVAHYATVGGKHDGMAFDIARRENGVVVERSL